jgi:hypothetical protein
METNRQISEQSLSVMQLWRKAGVDFDCGCKSSLAQLLELGGYFPLCKVEGRLPLSRNTLHQWSRGQGGDEFASCFMPIRAKVRGRAMTILVDLVRLNDLLSAQVQGRLAGRSQEPSGPGPAPAAFQEPA